MLKVKEELCLGCGLCVNNCPQQAIAIISGRARIDNRRCNECYTCVEVCPQGAIATLAPVSSDELQATVTTLKERTEDLIERINKLT
jgi:electron transfer flavoprotein alpha subunit